MRFQCKRFAKPSASKPAAFLRRGPMVPHNHPTMLQHRSICMKRGCGFPSGNVVAPTVPILRRTRAYVKRGRDPKVAAPCWRTQMHTRLAKTFTTTLPQVRPYPNPREPLCGRCSCRPRLCQPERGCGRAVRRAPPSRLCDPQPPSE